MSLRYLTESIRLSMISNEPRRAYFCFSGRFVILTNSTSVIRLDFPYFYQFSRNSISQIRYKMGAHKNPPLAPSVFVSGIQPKNWRVHAMFITQNKCHTSNRTRRSAEGEGRRKKKVGERRTIQAAGTRIAGFFNKQFRFKRKIVSDCLTMSMKPDDIGGTCD